MAKSEEPAIGIPYNAAYQFNQAPPPPIPQQYYVGANPYQDGMIPPNAVFGDPKGIPIQQTIYRDSPAPFNCLHCGGSGVTVVKSEMLSSAPEFMIPHTNNDKKVVIFGLPGAHTGVCSAQHVPSYKSNIDKFKAKGVDSVICVAVNDPYVMNGWAEKLEAKSAIEFYGDFDGSFHKSLDLTVDLSSALLGPRSHRWSAYVVDGNVKVLNVETAPSEFKVSGGDVILGQI